MKYLDEYRDPRAAVAVVERIDRAVSRSWTLMEVCGGQTHNLMRFGIDRSLPAGLSLVHGPGCAVGLATVEAIDQAQSIAVEKSVIFCTIGDVLRVPGSRSTLAELRERKGDRESAGGGDIRVVYSPLDALSLARKTPDRQVVFFAVGFETTACTTANAVLEAERLGLKNFSILGSHKRMASALKAILREPSNTIQAILAPGHACSVLGTRDFEVMAEELALPTVITGYEPVDLLEGILRGVQQLEEGRHEFENLYPKAVRREGNPQARLAVETVFEIATTDWRGLGLLDESSLALRERFRMFDAAQRFPSKRTALPVLDECQGGEVMTGRIKPTECPAFGRRCTLDHPLGAPMVSAEGTCSAYYRYRIRSELRTSSSAEPSNPLGLVPNAVVQRG